MLLRCIASNTVIRGMILWNRVGEGIGVENILLVTVYMVLSEKLSEKTVGFFGFLHFIPVNSHKF